MCVCVCVCVCARASLCVCVCVSMCVTTNINSVGHPSILQKRSTIQTTENPKTGTREKSTFSYISPHYPYLIPMSTRISNPDATKPDDW